MSAPDDLEKRVTEIERRLNGLARYLAGCIAFPYLALAYLLYEPFGLVAALAVAVIGLSAYLILNNTRGW